MPSTRQLHPLDQPILLGGNWVIAHLDRVEALYLQFTVSIATAPDAPILGGELAARLSATPIHPPPAPGAQPSAGEDGHLFAPIEAPDATHALPLVQSKGATAFVRYTFAPPA